MTDKDINDFAVAGPLSGADLFEDRQAGSRKVDLDHLIGYASNKPTARAATTAALPANTYANGTAGVGATLTGNSNGALAAQDGVTLAVGDSLLVKNEATTSHNGLCTLTQLGDGSSPYILTRHVAMDSAALFSGASVAIGAEGAANKNTIWLNNITSSFVVGTTAVVFSQVVAPAGAAAYDIIVALGDETIAITTGTAKVTLRAPRAMTLSKVKASLSTASSSGLPTFDVKKNGTSIFTTTLTIDATEKTSETAATPAVLSTTAIAADDELTFDISTAGTGATGAKIELVGTTP
jgi:hypothetical protein